jgi:hypothetical protein
MFGGLFGFCSVFVRFCSGRSVPRLSRVFVPRVVQGSNVLLVKGFGSLFAKSCPACPEFVPMFVPTLQVVDS